MSPRINHPIKLLSNWRVALVALVMALALMVSYQLGVSKPSAIIDFYDVVGEGSTLVLAVLGLILMVSTRPSGRVTNHFYSGGLIIVFSLTLDLLDEFVRYPDNLRLVSWLESLPQPLGLALLAIGALEWRREHLLVTRQLATREKSLREHQWLDPLTTLYTARYFHYLLKREMAYASETQQPLSIALINLTQFAEFNQQQGYAAGDKLLHKVSETASLLLRPSDCICREHSDRFLVLLPNTGKAEAGWLMQNLSDAINAELAGVENLRCQINTHFITEDTAEQALRALRRDVATSPTTIAAGAESEGLSGH